MKLTVLGNTGPYPGIGGACSGYLLEDGATKIVLDLGSGTLANLRGLCSLEDIDAIIVSHFHWDHVSDLYVLQYALAMEGLTIPVYAPDSPAEDYARLAAIPVFDVTPITPDLELTIGKLTLTFGEMNHPVKDYATKVTDGKWTFMYTGDTAMCDNLKTFGQGVQVLLCDSAFLDDRESELHLSVFQATDVASELEVRHLLLTHFQPDIRTEKYLQVANDRLKRGRVSCAQITAKINL